MLPTKQTNGPFASIVLAWLLLYSAKLAQSRKGLTCFKGEINASLVTKHEKEHRNKEYEVESNGITTSEAATSNGTCCVAIFAKMANNRNMTILIHGQARCAPDMTKGCTHFAKGNWPLAGSSEPTRLKEMTRCHCTGNKCNKMSDLARRTNNAINYTVQRWRREEKAKGCWRSRIIPHKVEGREEQPWCVNYYKLGETHAYPVWQGEQEAEKKCERSVTEKTSNRPFCFAENKEEWFCCCKRPFCNNMKEQPDMDPQEASRTATTKSRATTGTNTTAAGLLPQTTRLRLMLRLRFPTTTTSAGTTTEDPCLQDPICFSFKLAAIVAMVSCILLLLVILLLCCVCWMNRRKKKKKKMQQLSETQLSSLRPQRRKVSKPAVHRRAKKAEEASQQTSLMEQDEKSDMRQSPEKVEEVKGEKVPSLKTDTQSSSSHPTDDLSDDEEEDDEEKSRSHKVASLSCGSLSVSKGEKDVVVPSEQVDRGIGSATGDGDGGGLVLTSVRDPLQLDMPLPPEEISEEEE